MRSWQLAVSCVGLFAVGGSGLALAQDGPGPKLKVAVSILPQAYFVERVGGPHVETLVLVGPGQSPHSYEPTSKQIASLGQARVLFSIGVEFERAVLPRIQRMFRDLEVVDTRAGVPLREMSCHEAHDRGHDEAGGHAHEHHDHGGQKDPHIWLSPRLVKTQAATICAALCRHDPARSAEYKENLAAFCADLDQVHDRIAESLAPLKGREVFVFHPAFGYFCDEFGLVQVPVEIEGKEPTARQLAALIERARAAGVKVVFVEPQYSAKSARAVAQAIGGAVVPLDPLARDYLANLQRLAERIESGLKDT